MDFNWNLALFASKIKLNESHIEFCRLLSEEKSFLSLDKYEKIKNIKECFICNATNQKNLEFLKKEKKINYIINLKIQIKLIN